MMRVDEFPMGRLANGNAEVPTDGTRWWEREDGRLCA